MNSQKAYACRQFPYVCGVQLKIDSFTRLRQDAPRLPPLLESFGETGAAGRNGMATARFC